MTLVHTAEFFSQFRSSSENNTSKCDDVKKNKMANIFEIFFFDFNFVNPKKKNCTNIFVNSFSQALYKISF